MNYQILTVVLMSVALQSVSAPLVLSEKVRQLFTEVDGIPVTAGAAQVLSAKMLDTARAEGRPVAFRVTPRPLSTDDVDRISAEAGVPESYRRFAGYDAENGYCYYHAPRLSKLTDESKAGLKQLRNKSAAVLAKLLGDRSVLFVFANEETDWAMTKEHPEPYRTMYTCRYTRKVNGRHVVGNDAYARISFTGEGTLCGFEFCDPALEPEPVQRMVLPSATPRRLELYAAGKNSAHGTLKGDVAVTSIAAENGVYSYIGRTFGAYKLLVPAISIVCRHELDNGESFEKFRHFVIDASQVSNVDESMLEPAVR